MTIRGFPDQKKTGSTDAAGGQQFATVGPCRQQQNALDVIAHCYHQEIGTDAAEAGSTTTSVVATSHAALVGDVISFTSGALNTLEVRVKAVATNAITLAETMSAAPAAADTFKILRPKFAEVDSAGRLDVAVTFASDNNYGVVGASTLRTASQIGNATGAADFNDGNSGAQTLRVVVATDQPAFTVNVGTSGLPTGAATEVTAAAILADTANMDASLASIAAEDFATQTTLATLATEVTVAAILADTAAMDTNIAAILADTATIDTKTPALGQAAMAASTPVVLASDQSSVLVTPAATNIAYQGKGKIAGTALTGSYATVLDPTSDLRVVYLINNCNASILVSMDGGTTDTFELDPGESVTVDLAANGLKFSNAVNISAKHNGAAPTAGSIRVTGLG